MTTETNAQTPRTDAAEEAYRQWCILADEMEDKAPMPPDGGWDFARSLERELTAAESALAEANERARDQTANYLLATARAEAAESALEGAKKAMWDAQGELASLADVVASALRNTQMFGIAEEMNADDLRPYIWELSYTANMQRHRADALQSRLDAAERDARSGREAVIEECAKVCEGAYADPGWNGHIRNAAEGCARRIRSLAAHPAEPDWFKTLAKTAEPACALETGSVATECPRCHNDILRKCDYKPAEPAGKEFGND